MQKTERLIPSLFTCLQEGYDLKTLRQDIVAGLTVAIVALPLAMAMAVASGASPDKGLVTAVVAGFFILFCQYTFRMLQLPFVIHFPNNFFSIMLPTLRSNPCLVMGMPVVREIFCFNCVMPNARFHEKVRPGIPVFISSLYLGFEFLPLYI